MGLGGISPGSLLLIFLIILLIFGTRKLRNVGEDLGHAFKSFKKGLNEENTNNINVETNKINSSEKH